MDDTPPFGPGRTRSTLLLGAIFLLGMICGASLFYLGQRSVRGGPAGGPPPPRGQDPLGHMSRQLDLDPDQQGEIREILERYRVRIDTLLEDSRQDIRSTLRPEQQQSFDRLRPPHPLPPGPPPPHGARRPGRPPRRGGPPPPRDR